MFHCPRPHLHSNYGVHTALFIQFEYNSYKATPCSSMVCLCYSLEAVVNPSFSFNEICQNVITLSVCSLGAMPVCN